MQRYNWDMTLVPFHMNETHQGEDRLLLNGSREERAYATAKSFKLFCIFYFTKYFSYQPAPFHDDFFQDFEDLTYGRVKDAAWLAYRESAKTSIAKIGLDPSRRLRFARS